jgi:hypothetical protein
VVRAGALFPGNYNAAGDQRRQIRMRDGRQELLLIQEKYGLITLEPRRHPQQVLQICIRETFMRWLERVLRAVDYSPVVAARNLGMMKTRGLWCKAF